MPPAAEKTDIRITCPDGYVLAGSLFKRDQGADKGAVVICNALGISRKFYEKFARFLAGRGFAAVTFDYRGTGDSKSSRDDRDLELADWGRQDIGAAIEFAAGAGFSDRVFLVGHSLGGQLFCLSGQCETLAGAILVGASFPYWRRWPFPRNLSMFVFWYLLIPILGLGRKKFPTRKLGLSGEDLPVQFISRWGQWARNPAYVVSEKFSLDTRRFRTLTAPVLAYAFDDDAYAPERAVKKLLGAFEKARIEERFIRAKDAGTGRIGHFGYFKEASAATLWADTVSWMEKEGAPLPEVEPLSRES